MATLPSKNEKVAVDPGTDFVYVYASGEPSDRDKKMKVETLRAVDRAETLTNKTIGQPGTTKAAYVDRIQVGAAKLTWFGRAAVSMTIPNIADADEEDATFTLTDATVGDHVVVNPAGGMPAGLAIVCAWVSSANTVTVRIRNASGSPFVTDTQDMIALAIRSAAADV